MRLATRTERYTYLREKCGFLASEAKEYSKLNWKQTDPSTGESICPYFITAILNPRRANYYRFRMRGGKDADWASRIKRMYKRKKWYTVEEKYVKGKATPVRTQRLSPWLALHAAQKDWKRDVSPSYESPWVKRHRDMKKAEAKLNKKLNQKQDYGHIPRGQKRAMEDIERAFWGKPL